ncbi:MAG TPA: calcium-binding protein, partial [Planctomycetaceae bacterium]
GLGIYSITLGGKKERTVFDDPLVLETDPEYGGPGRLFLSFADLIEDIRLATVNLDTGESETLVSIPGADARLPKLAPNGEFVLFTSQVFDAQGDVQSESVGKVFLDPSGGPAGPPIFITDGIGSDAQAVVQPVVTFEVVQDPVTGRTLRITGTDGPDRVRVMVDPQDETQYLIEINGAFAGHVPVAEVDFVDIEMKAGDDVVALLGGSLFPVGVPARIQGGPGNDGLFGGSAADSIDGGEGDDELEGEGGDDTLNGGKGNDKLRGGRGNDHHSGGEGDDDMRDQTRSGETDTFDGGDGDDKVVAGGPGEVTVNGGPGDDEVTVSEVGDPDPDLLYWLDVYGGRGSDLLRGSRGREFFSGGPGGDDIRSGGGGDGIEGGGGPDEIDAGGGDDAVNPGPGNDDVDGGGGEDVLSEIDEVLVPSRGASLAASSGGDTLRGGPGDDVLRGGAGPDELYGDGGTDELEGGAGDDYLEGGTGGGDSCAGGSGRDRILIGTSRACEFYS